ncbi:hypothetical protein VPNG_04621 [Cytospora leucostoma]|uniref:Uncharacterized protein n=1 Tax=Cytospora leucostoma TaxID=1230097 RepID=A0A423XC61_9PEZI|nr:hypothetical protein VPNG_04621 [Cytospora leucostoma]
MSPFFRGGVRPPLRHPRPWSMNPRLNPDLKTDNTNEKGTFIDDETEIRLPVTNNIYGKYAGFTAAHPETPATEDGYTSKDEDVHQTLASVPNTNGGSTDLDTAGSTFDLDGDGATESAHAGDDFLVKCTTRDSGTAMMDSPFLNDFTDKGSTSLSPPHEGSLGVPLFQGHARADSSTIGTAVTQGLSGAVYGTQVPEADEDEGAFVDHTPAAVTGETPAETWFEAPIGQAVTVEHGAYEMPGGFPGGSEEVPITADGHFVADRVPDFVFGSAVRREPLIDDAQLEASEDFRPRTILEESEPEEPLVSDEQLDVGDEFKPQTAQQEHV